MKYLASILTKNMCSCIFCKSSNVEIHHVMNGSLRKKSTKYGLVVPLCRKHHEQVHKNQSIDNSLKKSTQIAFEKLYGHDKWMQEFHKNYKD